jgi:hypothetical protein
MKGVKMKRCYRLEIVRRASGRFGWIFVRIDDRGRRVLASSERSYRSRKRVRKVIAALGDADIVDTTQGYLPFPLPATSFRFVTGVVPLIVDESPSDDHRAVFAVSAEKAGKNHDRAAGKNHDRAEVQEEEPAGKKAK